MTFIPTEGVNFTRNSQLWNPQSANHPAGTAPWAVRCDGALDCFQVRRADQWAPDVGRAVPKNRSEFGSVTKFAYDTDIWISYAVRIPRVFQELPDDFMMIGQLHQTDNAGNFGASPPLAVQYQTHALNIYTRFNNENPRVDDGPQITQYRGDFRQGTWTRLVFDIIYSESPTGGKLIAWRDGTQIINQTGIGLGYTDTVGPSWKYGIYRDQTTQIADAHYANMELSTASLLRRVAHPLRIPGLSN